jgi:hypothetical protein
MMTLLPKETMEIVRKAKQFIYIVSRPVSAGNLNRRAICGSIEKRPVRTGVRPQ